jgi:hypothetical protein
MKKLSRQQEAPISAAKNQKGKQQQESIFPISPTRQQQRRGK